MTTAKLYVGIPLDFLITQSPTSLPGTLILPLTPSSHVKISSLGILILIDGIIPSIGVALFAHLPEYLGEIIPASFCLFLSNSNSSGVHQHL